MGIKTIEVQEAEKHLKELVSLVVKGEHIVLSENNTPIAESDEYEGVIIDYSKDRRIVAIEIIDAGKRTTKNPLDLIDLSIIKEKTVA